MSLSLILDHLNHPFVATTGIAIAAAIFAVVLHRVAVAIVRRMAGDSPYLTALLLKSHHPLQWLLPLLALQTVWAAAPAAYPGLSAWQHGSLLAIIVTTTWLVVNTLVATRDMIVLRYPADRMDNLQERRVQTQATVLMRTLSGVAIFIGISTALMTFPDVRQVGASLLASAGLAGLVVGFAAKPVLGNVIAGLQIALAQPIRIDDVVIVEGEWGRIEAITGTFVVVRIWDQRCLIVPLQWFIEHPFQNWTHTSANIVGAVILWVDYALPLEPLRRELERTCKLAPEWDGKVCVLQVTETSERAMQVRALVSSTDSGRNWDLRCRVREGLIGFLQRDFPQALPRQRAEIVGAKPIEACFNP